MFRLALTSHSCISIPPENPIIVVMFFKYGHLRSFDKSQLNALMKDICLEPVSILNRWKMSESAIRSILETSVGCSYAEVCAKLYRAYPRPDGMNSIVWGDKNTSYYRYLEILNWLFPKARFIHLVRDGRAVLASNKALLTNKGDNIRYPVLPADPIIAGTRWSDAVRVSDSFLSKLGQDQYLNVRYEDVVTDFESQMCRVCQFLELSYEPEMEKFHEFNRKFELEPRDYDSWKWRTRQPITTNRVDVWQQTLSSLDIARFEAVAGKVLLAQGYQLQDNRAQLSFNDRIKWARESARLNLRSFMRHGRFLCKKTTSNKNKISD